MAPKFKGRFPNFKTLFTGVKGRVNHLVQEALKSPLSWKSVFWDSYFANEFPDHMMRVTKIFVGLTFVARLISSAALGLFLFVDGIYSIYRHRFELHVTKSWYEDVPRAARSLFGLVLIVGLL